MTSHKGFTISYFGYGSNLWKEQMKSRCESSNYLGVGRLPAYRWIINSRGYANVVPSTKASDEVYGLIYSLTLSDESALDVNEGVPYAYTKEMLSVDFWASTDCSRTVDVTSAAGEKMDMLVYIDRERIQDSVPKDEYVYRMNMGIKDGLKAGIPQDYVDKVMRPFIPAEDMKHLEKQARQQALKFEDKR
ncbi:gamma-glutamylcyclotransferase, partial [Lecanoromycetidae sp. Uapishka_2]